MRPLNVNETNVISGGESTMVTEWENWNYDMTDVIDDVSSMALLGVAVNVYLNGSFTANVVRSGAVLGAYIGAAYGVFNFVGYKLFDN